MLCITNDGDGWEVTDLSDQGEGLEGHRLAIFDHVYTAIECMAAISIGQALTDLAWSAKTAHMDLGDVLWGGVFIPWPVYIDELWKEVQCKGKQDKELLDKLWSEIARAVNHELANHYAGHKIHWPTILAAKAAAKAAWKAGLVGRPTSIEAMCALKSFLMKKITP